tara:strand:+ start:50 stop:289 length:240 start_codon:yes stop_codon:yes gene_type:complete
MRRIKLKEFIKNRFQIHDSSLFLVNSLIFSTLEWIIELINTEMKNVISTLAMKIPAPVQDSPPFLPSNNNQEISAAELK